MNNVAMQYTHLSYLATIDRFPRAIDFTVIDWCSTVSKALMTQDGLVYRSKVGGGTIVGKVTSVWTDESKNVSLTLTTTCLCER